MIVIADTSGILAAIDKSNDLYQSCRKVFARAQTIVVTPFVLAEVDYMLTTRFTSQIALDFLDEVIDGACAVHDVTASTLTSARAVMAQYLDLEIGLTDAANVVAANECHTDLILTLDQRHFRTVAPTHPDFDTFKLLPYDG